MNILQIVLGMTGLAILAILPGWLAYSGRWRDWINHWSGLHAPFAMLWMGVGGEFAGLGALFEQAGLPIMPRVLRVVAMGLIVLGGFCMFWTPPPLRPRWHRELTKKQKG